MIIEDCILHNILYVAVNILLLKIITIIHNQGWILSLTKRGANGGLRI
jgi:hypothetical protein